MDQGRPIAVLGATGRQGGAVAQQLLARGWRVRAVTRAPEAAGARALRTLGAEVVAGNLSEVGTLREAFRGVHGVFGVTDFWEHGHAGEVRQGKNLVDAAVAAKVEHVVLSTVGGADRAQTRHIPLIDSKRIVEDYLAHAGLRWSVLRPVTFFENFVSARYRRAICRGRIRFAIEPDKPFQMIAMRDLAVFAEYAFAGSPVFQRRAVEVASDRLTMRQFAEVLATEIGRPVRYEQLSWPTLRVLAAYVELTRTSAHYKTGAALLPLFRWMQDSPLGGWDADLNALRTVHPDALSAADWAATIAWRDGRDLRP